MIMIVSWFPRLTLFGRSLLLLLVELSANALCWILAGVFWGRSEKSLLSLALLAWTLGLRHGEFRPRLQARIDGDGLRSSKLLTQTTSGHWSLPWKTHTETQIFSAIDNATRSLIGQGQLPVTCGLFFSLGHSTIVIAVNLAIVISVDVYNRIDGVGNVGGVIGAAVSGSFLFIVGLANAIILYRAIQKRRRLSKKEDSTEDEENIKQNNNTIMMKIIGPIITFVDRPWKMYVVGVLFGLGFDTTSSIALLAVSAIANGHVGHSGEVIILPLLFTSGMTIIDSVDSILMLYSYAGFPERSSSWAIFRKRADPGNAEADAVQTTEKNPDKVDTSDPEKDAVDIHTVSRIQGQKDSDNEPTVTHKATGAHVNLAKKANMISGLSIALTFMSVLVAFSISIITIMSLIGDQCTPCRNAAEADDGRGGGLAGRWWRFWGTVNDNSQWIGTGIVGSFILVVSGWYGMRWISRRLQAKRRVSDTRQDEAIGDLPRQASA